MRPQSKPFKVRDPDRPIYPWDDPVSWKALFEKTAANPRSWQEEARRLACAANVLMWAIEDRPQKNNLQTSGYLSIKSVLFLYALAVENLIKGIWVARGGQPLLNGVLAKKLSTHQLGLLTRQAGINLSNRDAGLLDWLQQLIESGKYPISRSLERQLRLPGFGLSSTIPRILALLEQLEADMADSVSPQRICTPIDYSRLGTPKGHPLVPETVAR